MFKGMKRKAMLVGLAVLALGNCLSVSATSSIETAEYSGYVTKFKDYTTDTEHPLFKSTHGNGTNKVESLPEGEELCSWINNYLGNRVTYKKNYDCTGTHYMIFTQTADVEHPGGHLATTMTISTQLQELSSANTSGIWSPDTF